MLSGTRNRFINIARVSVFSPLLHHICGGVGRGQTSRTSGNKLLKLRGRLPLRQKHQQQNNAEN
jgi:hypothetical protein